MTSKHTPEPSRLINLLTAGLNVLQGGSVSLFPPPSDTEINALIRALNDGRIRILPGVSNVVTFKRTAKEASCNL